MRSEGFPFTVGGLGVGPVFASVSRLVVCRRWSSLVVVGRRLGCVKSVPMVKVANGVIFACFRGRLATFHVAGVALRDMWTCWVTRRKSQCLWGKLQNLSFSSKQVFMWFCGAGVALRDSLHTTLRTPHFPFHTPHSTLYTPHFTLYTPQLTL